MNKLIIVKYNEIILKGKNRSFFENKLIDNIKIFLEKNKIKYKIKKSQGKILVYTNKTKKSIKILKNIFGVIYINPAIETKTKFENIKKFSFKLLKNLNKNKTFGIYTKRINKKFLLSSYALNKKLGNIICKKTKAKVNLSKPDMPLHIIIQDKAYLFTKKIKCFGGLPVGTQGLATLLLENKDSIKAGKLVMKRGCSIEIIKKKNISIKELQKFSPYKIKTVKKPSEKSYAIIVAEKLPTQKRDYKLPILYPLVGQ